MTITTTFQRTTSNHQHTILTALDESTPTDSATVTVRVFGSRTRILTGGMRADLMAMERNGLVRRVEVDGAGSGAARSRALMRWEE